MLNMWVFISAQIQEIAVFYSQVTETCKANPNAVEISLLLMWAQSAHDPYRFNCSECHSVIKFSIWVENLILFFEKWLPFFSGLVGT